MARVSGIGGVFFKAKDPAALRAWYQDNLGIAIDPSFGGAVFNWPDGQGPDRPGSTVFSIFTAETSYFSPGTASFMVNFRVDDLDALLAELRAKGAAVDEKVESMDGIGRFGWVVDPEGNKVELWEPATGC